MRASCLKNRIQVFIGRRRWLKRLLRRWLAENAYVEVREGVKLYLDLRDFRGPSFYVLFGGPEAFGHYEKQEKDAIVAALPENGVLLDVGANIGLFSLYAAFARPDSRVIAFEPHPKLHACLSRTVQESRIGNLEALRVAAGAAPGTLPLYMDETDSGGHSLLEEALTNNRSASSRVEVPVLRLDDVARERGLQRVDVIKIDVQGFECEVLRGAAGLLRDFKPTLMLELDYRMADKVLAAIQGGYEFRQIGSESWRPLGELAVEAERSLAAGSLQGNYLFRPAR